MEKLTIELIKLRGKNNEQTETFNLRLQMDLKIKELENENKNLKNEKQKVEIDHKILQDKHFDISKKYEVDSKDLILLKSRQNEVKLIFLH